LLYWTLCAEDLGFLGREFLVRQDALLEKVAKLLQLGSGVIAQPPGRGRDHSRCYRRCGRLLIGERSRDLGVHLRLLLRPGLPVSRDTSDHGRRTGDHRCPRHGAKQARAPASRPAAPPSHAGPLSADAAASAALTTSSGTRSWATTWPPAWATASAKAVTHRSSHTTSADALPGASASPARGHQEGRRAGRRLLGFSVAAFDED